METTLTVDTGAAILHLHKRRISRCFYQHAPGSRAKSVAACDGVGGHGGSFMI